MEIYRSQTTLFPTRWRRHIGLVRPKRSVVRLGLCLGLMLSACGMEPGDETLIEEADDLFYRENTLWNPRDIRVCWTKGGFDQEKAWVKAAVRGQRSWSSSGDLNFVGWGRCSFWARGIRLVPGDSMVARFLGDSGWRTTVELDFTAAPQNRWTRCRVNNLSRKDCITTVGLHEFGHALSFAHEHNRSDTPDSCTSAPQGTNGDSTYGPWDGKSIMNYCGGASELSGIDLTGTDFAYGARYVDRPLAGDYNGDGKDDLLCHDVVTGKKWIDLANASGHLFGTNWSRDARWCNHDAAELFKGDFNGDGRTDMLCHDNKTGKKWVDLADGAGHFGGTDWSRDAGWCNHATGRLLVGDFNGDARDDILCHDISTGKKWIDFANASGQFLGTNWSRESNWCRHDNGRLFVGDFNGDGRDDLLCHDVSTGKKWVDLANASGQFLGTDWSRAANWCRGSGAQLFIGDFNGDARDDLLCHHVTSGKKWIDLANASGHFWGDQLEPRRKLVQAQRFPFDGGATSMEIPKTIFCVMTWRRAKSGSILPTM